MRGSQVGCELEPLFKGKALWLKKTCILGTQLIFLLCLGVFFFFPPVVDTFIPCTFPTLWVSESVEEGASLIPFLSPDPRP